MNLSVKHFTRHVLTTVLHIVNSFIRISRKGVPLLCPLTSTHTNILNLKKEDKSGEKRMY